MIGGEGRPLSRALSATIALAYLAAALARGDAVLAVRIVLFCVVPVACIWFPDVLGNYAGIFSITTTSPASFVWFLGWVVLLLPVIVVPFVWLEGVGLGPGG
jgi:hypothetical protein